MSTIVHDCRHFVTKTPFTKGQESAQLQTIVHKLQRVAFQRPWVYPYPSVSDFAGRNSDHGPSKTQTKTQTTRQTLYLPGKGETQTMV